MKSKQGALFLTVFVATLAALALRPSVSRLSGGMI